MGTPALEKRPALYFIVLNWKSVFKRATKLFEQVPSSPNEDIAEVFDHPAYLEADQETKEGLALSTSEFRLKYALEMPWDMRLFGFDFAPQLRGQSVLDLGCFTGGRTVAWAERREPHSIYGVDVRPCFLSTARAFAKRSGGVKASFICAVGEWLPFDQNVFDALLAFDVFEHVRDVRRVLEESKRILKEGGKLFVAFPSFWHPYEHHLSPVTLTPFLHWIFDSDSLIAAYNEILEERGQEADWYKRSNSRLED